MTSTEWYSSLPTFTPTTTAKSIAGDQVGVVSAIKPGSYVRGMSFEERQALPRVFSVQISVNPHSRDEMWETITHFAQFESVEQAEALKAAIIKKGEINLTHWLWSPSICSPYGYMHTRPVAKRTVIGF